MEKDALERKFKNWAKDMQTEYHDTQEEDVDKVRKDEFEHLFANITNEFMK